MSHDSQGLASLRYQTGIDGMKFVLSSQKGLLPEANPATRFTERHSDTWEHIISNQVRPIARLWGHSMLDCNKRETSVCPHISPRLSVSHSGNQARYPTAYDSTCILKHKVHRLSKSASTTRTRRRKLRNAQSRWLLHAQLTQATGETF